MFNFLCVILIIGIFWLYRNNRWFKSLLDKNSSVVTFSVSLITLFLVFATWNLATSTKEMSGSLKEQVALFETQSVSLDSQAKQLKKNVEIQKDSFDLEFRPYISMRLVDFSVIQGKRDTFIGGNILYRNFGKTPADNVATRFYITTKEDGIGNRSLEGYAQEEWGGYKKVSFLSPGELDTVTRRLSLSPSTTIYYINAIVTYEGIAENKTYWAFLKKVIRIKNITQTKPIIIEIDSEGKWDRNKNFTVPELEKPDFDQYKTK